MEEERSQTYFMCGKKSLSKLFGKAKAEAEKILSEFSEFYDTGGKLGITIEPVSHGDGMSYSVAATLTWDGKPIQKRDDPCELLFLQLHNLMLDRMLQLGIPSVVSSDK